MWFAVRARQTLMCHVGFQQLYKEKADNEDYLSPKDTIHKVLAKYKDSLEKVTVVGHSLGGGNPAVVVVGVMLLVCRYVLSIDLI